MNEKKHLNFELRSEDIQDILSRAPSWMISWGNSLIFLMSILVITLSYFIKYPDVISGTAVISTSQPPVYISSNVDGRISKVLVEEGQVVVSGQVLIELENPVSLESIDALKSYISDVEFFLKNPVEGGFSQVNNVPDLYEANMAYLQLNNKIKEYETFLFDKRSLAEKDELKIRLNKAKELYTIGQSELKLSKQEIQNAKQKYAMQEQEYNKGYTTKLNFLDAQSNYIQVLKQEENLKKIQLDLDLSVFNLQSQIEKFDRQRLLKRKELEQVIEQGLSGMKNFVVSWESDYTIKSPSTGRAEFLERITERQSVNASEEIVAIIQEEESFEVIAVVPGEGFGKVDIGNQVKLKVDNFPFEQFGLLNGKVSSYSSLSKEDEYVVEITLPNELQTTYNQTLKYTPEMSAIAEIITEDLRLIERLFNSLRSIFTN